MKRIRIIASSAVYLAIGAPCLCTVAAGFVSPSLPPLTRTSRSQNRSRTFLSMSENGRTKKGKLLVLGGTGEFCVNSNKQRCVRDQNVHAFIPQIFSFFVYSGFLGQAVCKRAALDGYQVTSLSRRGRPPSVADETPSPSNTNINYLAGDAREKSAIASILSDGSYVGKCVDFMII